MTNNETRSKKYKEYTYSLNIKDNSTAAKTLNLVGKGKKVLELGCSVGTQSKILTENLNCEVTGIELNPVAAAQAEEYCTKVLVGNLDQIDFKSELPNQKFDVILCADVIEHIYAPTVMLNKVKSVINTNGYIVASIPNIVHIALIFEMLHGKFDYRDKGLLDDSHIRFFTRQSLINTFSEAGFKLEHLDRGIADLSGTEFTVEPHTPEDIAVLDYIKTNNEECFTYHFIVKAFPSNDTLVEIKNHNTKFELKNVTKILHNKENQILQQERHISSLQSQIDWIENKTIFRLAKKIRSFFTRKT